MAVFLGTGVLGGFTTMSAASFDTFALLDAGHVGSAAAYGVGTLAAALLAVALVDRRGRARLARRGASARTATSDRAAGRARRRSGGSAALLVGRHLDRLRLHWGTLLVNLVGSAVLGALVGRSGPGHPMALLGTGFCGGLTTYSAFTVQAVAAARAAARRTPSSRSAAAC